MISVSPQQRRIREVAGDDAGAGLSHFWSVELVGPLPERSLDAALRRLADELPWPLPEPPATRVRFEREDDLAASLSPAELDRLLSGDEPIQARVVTGRDTKSILLLKVPALAADAASGAAIVETLLDLMTGAGAGTPGGTDSPDQRHRRATYVSYVAPMTELLESPEIRGWEYWTDASIETLVRVPLPFDRVGEGAGDHAGNGAGSRRCDGIAARLSPALTDRIRTIAAENQSSVPGVVLTCWTIALRRLTGRDEMAIAVTCDGRTFDGSAAAIGPFARHLPLICRAPAPDATFADALERTTMVLLDAALNQEYFAWDKTGVTWPEERVPGCTLAFQPLDEPRAIVRGEVEARITGTFSLDDLYDVRLQAGETDQGLCLELQYDLRRYRRSDIESMLDALVLAVECAAGETDRIADWETVGERERQQLLTFSGARAAVDEMTVPALVAARAAETPDALAVVAGGERVSYAELDARANRLAASLRRHAVGPEVVVAVHLERSVDAIVAILGIMKAGGVYVPLDLASPAARLRDLLGDAGARAVIARPGAADAFCPAGVARISLDAASLAEESDAPIASGAHPSNAAYVMFTSGSTGRPKGVVVEHRSLLAYVAALRRVLPLPPGASYAMVSTFAADLGHTMVFGALCGGGCLHVISERVAADPRAYADYTRQHGIDCLKIVPSHLSVLLESGTPADILPRRVLMLGGEAASDALLERLVQAKPACTLVNHYGPTETTIGVLTYTAAAIDGTCPQPLPLGRPIPNARTYVLDSGLRLAPRGAAGELCVGGAAVARGYIGRPGLTAERFVPDPFAGEPGARMYRTGDRTRYREDGNVLFGGRADDQVKLRGYRIELEEITRVLRRHPGVREAAALFDASRSQIDAFVTLVSPSGAIAGRPDYAGALVAAAAAGSAAGHQQTADVAIASDPAVMTRTGLVEPALAPAELRDFLREQMPSYMIPSGIYVADALPLNANGKVDRAALAALRPRPSLDDSGRPRTPIEEVIAGIFADVLKLDQVGIHDNFFERGGDSLRSIQVMWRIGATLSAELPLPTMFESPTVAALAEVVAASLQAGTPAAPPLVRAVRPPDVPLSYAQQRLWFLDQLAPAHSAYNSPIALRLRGALDEQALDGSLQAIVARHEILRVSLVPAYGRAVQRIADHVTLPIRIEPIAEADVAAAIREECGRGFTLQRAPLLRVTLFRLAEHDHILLVVLHHIVSDGWSLPILVREFAELYRAAVSGEPLELPELPIQYADYALWQRQWLESGERDRQLSWWRTQLEALPSLTLPMARPRPLTPTHAGARVTMEVGAELTAALRRLARAEGATLHMTLLAGLGTLLSRYSGQSDIVVGTAVAGRGRRETADLVGFFVNLIVLRMDLSGEPSFRALLDRVRRAALGAYAHQDVPFEMVVEELQPDRDLRRQPLFQVVFTLQRASGGLRALPDLEVEPVTTEGTEAKFDLTFEVIEHAETMAFHVEYATELFDEDAIAQLMRHWQRVLAAAAAAPDAPLSHVELLDASERAALDEWNAAARPYPPRPVHALVAEQASRTPDAMAVRDRDESWTYRDLEARATVLAARLHAAGVEPEQLVGVCLERSPRLVAALLGVLKAGGAYVPLEPSYPAERLRFMMRDAGLRIVLTDARLRPIVSAAHPDVAVIIVDDLDTRDAAAANLPAPPDLADRPDLPGTSDRAVVHPDRLAYVMYTSGSTGTPKGVAITHRNIVRLVLNTDYVTFTPDDVVGQLANTSFDAATFEIWGALLTGAQIAVLDRDRGLSIAGLREEIAQSGVTMLFMTAGLFHQVVNEDPAAFASFACLLVGGEAMDVARTAAVVANGPPARLLNAYGPTETTTFATWMEIAQCDPRDASVPIGRPLANTQVYVFDHGMRASPAGVAGELYIGGSGLARGYWARPSLTAERFVPHPYATEPGARLYRTGDIVTRRGDRLSFVRRADDQVKIRGFRVELGEVEHAIRLHPKVRDAVVLGRPAPDGGLRLVAYVVADRTVLADSALIEFLRTSIPEFLVPSRIVLLDALPLTPNGKTDREALAALEAGAAATDGPDREAAIAPRDRLELALVRVWEDLLGTSEFDVRSDFFTIGGTSLLSLALVSRITTELGTAIPAALVFQNRTIETQAAVIRERARWTPVLSGDILIPLTRGSDRPLLALVHTGSGTALCYYELAQAIADRAQVYGIQSPGLLEETPIYRTVEQSATYYIEQLLQVQPRGPYRLGGVSAGAPVAFEMARQLTARGAEVALVVLFDASAPPVGRTVTLPSEDDLLWDVLLQIGVSSLDEGTFRAMSYDERLLHVTVCAKQTRRAPPDLEPVQIQRLVTLLSNAGQAKAAYAAGPYDGRVVLFRAEDQAEDPAMSRMLGWERFCTNLEIAFVGGTHSTMLYQGFVPRLAAALTPYL